MTRDPFPVEHQTARRIRMDWTSWLFLVFAGYSAVPFIDIPVVGLSLSAPIFYFIAVEIFFKPKKGMRTGNGQWGRLAILLWFGIMLAGFLNGLISEGSYFDKQCFLALLRYTYWIMVFWITALMVSAKDLGSKVSGVLAVLIVGLACLRWYEGVFYGSIGAWTRLRFMTQNNYGMLFSCFGILPLAFGLAGKGKYKIWSFLGVFLIWGAVIINGSRTSWITMSAGVIVCLFVYMKAFAHKGRAIMKGLLVAVFLGALSAAGYVLSPASVKESFQHRFSTFKTLDEDKSYQIRKLMVQKAVKIFKRNPLAGCGPGAFRKTNVDLEIPRVLQYEKADYFNAKSSHNSYAQFLAEAGLLGAIPFGLLLLGLIIKGLRASIELTREGCFWAMGFYASTVMMSIHLWSISALYNTATWMIYGMITGVIILARKRKIEKRNRHRQALQELPA